MHSLLGGMFIYYTSEYYSPLGNINLAADGTSLTGLWFEGQKYFDLPLDRKQNLPIFDTAKKWLDTYFSGKNPEFKVPIRFTGTEFQNEVWKILCSIPYGKTVTYGEIAEQIAKRRNIPYMSAQAVGGAVGHNRISIIIPCHRVIGANGYLTGYAGGLDRKAALLKLEGYSSCKF